MAGRWRGSESRLDGRRHLLTNERPYPVLGQGSWGYRIGLLGPLLVVVCHRARGKGRSRAARRLELERRETRTGGWFAAAWVYVVESGAV